ncbi:MAG: hypothetical protein IT175_04765, partial [Acidobacteria bacterium]|nr:hypothetical protein [Acidobacteriota bacterium]
MTDKPIPKQDRNTNGPGIDGVTDVAVQGPNRRLLIGIVAAIVLVVLIA